MKTPSPLSPRTSTPRTFTIHDAEVSEVMSEVSADYWPGCRLLSLDPALSAVEPEGASVLTRWEAEDAADEADMETVETLLEWMLPLAPGTL